MTTDDDIREITDGLAQAVGLAWADPEFKAQLLDDPTSAFAQIDLRWPEQHPIEFYDDPAAKPGDWSLAEDGSGKMRVPIPQAPSDEDVSEDDLAQIGGARSHHNTVACSCSTLTACCCTGVASPDNAH
ncbi:hypothetical protein GCM10009808_03930 [Microbacterium sediminicola]|uniref:NHLP leader peptide domain-containing protein n=1 Tax=Microbacterium sediminicola TaxID=415210 RepID=A0ABN2HM82_9MICO